MSSIIRHTKTIDMPTFDMPTLVFKSIVITLVSVAGGWGFSSEVNAGEWRFSAGTDVGAEYSDNVDSGSNGSSRVVLDVSPRISLHGESARLKADLDGSWQLNDLGGNQGSSNPRLQADATLEMLEDRLFVDGSSRITANAIDPFSSSGSNLSSNNSNRTNTISYDISPYLVWRFGQVADAELRYTYNAQSDSEDSVDESTSEEYALMLNSGRYFGPFSWGLSLSNEEIDYDQSADSEFESINLTLGYQVDRQWRLTASLGEDTNDFPSTDSKTGGGSWTVGTVWTPNSRVSVDVSAGEAFYGDTQSLDASYQRKRSTFTAGYSKGITNARTLLRDQQIFFIVDDFGQPIIDPITGFPFTVALDVAQLNEGNFIDERLDLGYAWRGKRTSARVYLNHSRQTSLDGLSSGGKLKNISFSLNRELSRHMSADTSISLSDTQSSSGSDAETWRYNLGITRQLGEKTSASVRYYHNNRDSNGSGDSSKENRISVSFSFDL